MDSLETTPRAQFEAKLQSRQVRETLGAEVNSGPSCLFPWGLRFYSERLQNKTFCKIEL